MAMLYGEIIGKVINIEAQLLIFETITFDRIYLLAFTSFLLRPGIPFTDKYLSPY